MNNRIKNMAALLSILLIVGIAAAGNGEDTFEPASQAYLAPTLITSINPEPVTYAPGTQVQGYVTLELKVDVNGDVEQVKVLYRTSPLAVKSAVRAVEQWKFNPATFNGKSVAAYVAYSVPFGQNLQIFANDNYVDRIVDPVNGDQIAMR